MNPAHQKNNRQGNDLSEIIEPYLKNWFWFGISLIVFLVLATVNIRYTTPKYKATTKIQIIDKENANSALDLFSDLGGVFKANSNKVEDEIEIIASRSNLIEVVRKLNLNTRIYYQGNILNTELYNNSPINLNFIGQDSTFNRSELDFYLDLDGDTSFTYAEVDSEVEKRYDYGKNFSTSIGSIVVTPNERYFKKYKGKQLKVTISPVIDVAESYRKKITIEQSDEFSNILTVSLVDEKKEKARDILDELVDIYNKNAIEDKQIIADRTSKFINDRIADISSSLTNVDQSAEQFKRERGVTDLATEASLNLNVGASNRQELAEAETQLNIAAGMREIVDSQEEGFDVIPPNVGLNDPTIAATTQRYNQLVQERNRLLKSSNPKNPVIVNLDGELRDLRRTMQSSLNNMVNNLSLQVNTLSGQQAIIRSRIYSAPKTERALRDITRRQQTTEQLYLYLLQKREEAQIAVASTSPKSKVIDRAYYSDIPVAPKIKAIYLLFGLLGLGLPFTIIYVGVLLDDKVHNMYQVERMVDDIPVLGELPKVGRRQSKIVINDDRSVLAEALRIIRTNLDYLIRTKKPGETHKNNIVFITSSVSGEGKTFLSVNLSMILSATDKKVLLIGGDVRNPKFKRFFQNKNIGVTDIQNSRTNSGLSEYLFDYDLSPADITNRVTLFNNSIDVIYSGRIPPNPSELLMSDRLGELLSESSEKYDYVIVDTSPMMLVSDTLLIAHFANHIIYVTRAEVTEKRNLEFPTRLKNEGKIKGLAFVVNDVKTSNLGYGGKYGYGYGKKRRKWWKIGG